MKLNMIAEEIKRLSDIKKRLREKIGGVAAVGDKRIDEYVFYAAKVLSWNPNFDLHISHEGTDYYPSYDGFRQEVRKAGEMLSYTLVTSGPWEVDMDASQIHGAHLYATSGDGGEQQFKMDLPTVDVNTEYVICIRNFGCPMLLRISQKL